MLEDAIAFAARAHTGQIDKAGIPYILHPLRVMMAFDSLELRVAAVLHDVVEDTGATLADIEMRFGVRMREIIDALTRRKGESYDDFIDRCALDVAARHVKLADIRDNKQRLAGLRLQDSELADRLDTRYRVAFHTLINAGATEPAS